MVFLRDCFNHLICLYILKIKGLDLIDLLLPIESHGSTVAMPKLKSNIAFLV